MCNPKLDISVTDYIIIPRNVTDLNIQKKTEKCPSLTHSIRIIFPKALLVGHMHQALWICPNTRSKRSSPVSNIPKLAVCKENLCYSIFHSDRQRVCAEC